MCKIRRAIGKTKDIKIKMAASVEKNLKVKKKTKTKSNKNNHLNDNYYSERFDKM